MLAPVTVMPARNPVAAQFAAVVPEFAAIMAKVATIVNDVTVNLARFAVHRAAVHGCGTDLGGREARGHRDRKRGQQKFSHFFSPIRGSHRCDREETLPPAD